MNPFNPIEVIRRATELGGMFSNATAMANAAGEARQRRANAVELARFTTYVACLPEAGDTTVDVGMSNVLPLHSTVPKLDETVFPQAVAR